MGKKREIDRSKPEDEQFERPEGLSIHALFSDEDVSEIECNWHSDRFGPKGKSSEYHILVYGSMDIETMPERGLEIGMALYESGGNLVDIKQVVVKRKPEGKGLLFYDILKSTNKPAYVRCFVRDKKNGKINSKTLKLSVPLFSDMRFHLSDICLSNAQQIPVLSIHKIRQAQSKDLSLYFDGPFDALDFVPSVDNLVAPGQGVTFIFELYDNFLPMDKVDVGIALIKNGIPGKVID